MRWLNGLRQQHIAAVTTGRSGKAKDRSMGRDMGVDRKSLMTQAPV